MINRPEPSLTELFQEEARAQTAILSAQLLALEAGGHTPERLQALMRSAHSLKGAAKIVGRDVVLRVAHAMEDWFVAAQHEGTPVTRDQLDVLLCAVDFLRAGAALADDAVMGWVTANSSTIATLLGALAAPRSGAPADLSALRAARCWSPTPAASPAIAMDATVASSVLPLHRVPTADASHGDQRVGAGSLDRLLSLTSDALVASRMLQAHSSDSRAHRRSQYELGQAIDTLREALVGVPLDPRARRALTTMRRCAAERQDIRRQRDDALDAISERLAGVVGRLHQEVLDSRMRPFEEGLVAFPRMVRDLTRELGKDAQFVVAGGSTPVDRDVLRRLEVPLVHLLRNAVDHGINTEAERVEAGKPRRATITVTARHVGGRLLVAVEDDGRGIDAGAVREAIVRKRLADTAVAAAMSDKELFEFLFLPGFSMRDEVTDLSGRGVGLDAVRTAVHDIGGTIRVSTEVGRGTRFEMQLPLTLSVVRALIVEVSGQPCAIPLARIRCVLRVPGERIESVEGRQHFSLGDRQVGLLWAHQVLGIEAPPASYGSTAVVVIDDHEFSHGLAVDQLLGEQEIVLRGLDSQLGKVENIGAAALLPDGAPVLVLDVDDVVRSIANLLDGGRLDPLRPVATGAQTAPKRVLVADDSLTVRALEQKLIAARGYDVVLAVDGMDAWNALRAGHYDLLVTDVDMPRMTGVELIALVRRDPTLRSLPIMIVSYKDREEDRQLGLEAGADHYLTKASFYDETMLRAIEDLIGAPTS